MSQRTDFPKSIHSDIQPQAIGNVLAQFYNVGITNPWYEQGLSDQKTYARRRLPWAGHSYSVREDGTVVTEDGPDVKEGLKQQWRNLARESRQNGAGEFYADLEELKEERLDVIGDELREDKMTFTTSGGEEVNRLPSEITDAQAARQGINNGNGE